MLETIQKHDIMLALFAMGLTGLTAAIGQMTRTAIAEQANLQQKTLFDQVLPVKHYNNALAQSCCLVTAPELGKGGHRVYIAKQNGKPVAVVLEATVPDNYSGAIQLLVGADFNDMVLGTHVAEHHETPGLGDKIKPRLSDWIAHFMGGRISSTDDTNRAVKRDGGDFGQFTGATVAPHAMVNAVKRAGLCTQTLPVQLSQLPAYGKQNVNEIKDVVIRGLWRSNSTLVQLSGLCPLLAVTSAATSALSLRLTTTLVLALTSLAVSTLHHWTPAEIRIPIYVVITASMVSAIQMLINAYAFGLYQSLGIFIPLTVTSCTVVGRAEVFAAKKGPALSALGGSSIDVGTTCAMFVLGSLREIIGNGMLFNDADTLLGSWAKVLRVEIFCTSSPFLLAMLPPGAFIGLGLILTGKYLIDEKVKKRRTETVAEHALPNDETGNV